MKKRFQISQICIRAHRFERKMYHIVYYDFVPYLGSMQRSATAGAPDDDAEMELHEPSLRQMAYSFKSL